jgi:multidrug efflux pump subunit AcrA (membrane-fusion protein)
MRRKKMRRRKLTKKKRIAAVGVVAAVLVIGGTTIFVVRGRGRVQAMTPAQAMSTTVSTGSISTTVVGTGTLQNDTANAVKIPDGLTIDEVLVESGDTVKEGDVLAIVNQASVLSALSDVRDQLDDLDEEINDAKGDKESSTVKTYISGRVKVIYAVEGDDVSDVMNENGALLLLSIDGKMAVTLEGVSGVSTGDTVTVVLDDDSTTEGTVESVTDDTCVVTISDEDAAVDEKVTVKDSDDKKLGKGRLYVHQPIEITGTGGTVSSISVSVNDEVSADSTLMKLTNVPDSAEYQQLLASRSDLAETLKMLTQLASDNTIKAEYDGIIASVNVTAESSGTTGTSSGQGAMNLSSTKKETAVLTNASATSKEPSFVYASDTTKTTEETSKVTSITDMEELIKELAVTAPATDGVPTTQIKETDAYTGTIQWTPSSGTFAEKTSYTAVIELKAKTGYQFVIPAGTQIQWPDAQTTSWEIKEQCEENTLKFTVTFPETAAKETETNGSENGGAAANGAGANKAETNGTETNGTEGTGVNGTGTAGTEGAGTNGTGTNSAGVDGAGQTGTSGQETNGAGGTVSGSTVAGQTATGGTVTGQTAAGGTVTGGTASGSATGGTSGSVSGSLSASASGSTAGTASTTSQTTGTSSDSTDSSMVTAFTICQSENMKLTVNIDELDILSIQEGQKVTVTLDALEGEEFEGEITKINYTASNNGGVTKYTAEVTIPKTDSMLAGMNASATIITESVEDVLTIPADALQEHGNSTYVYTEEDSDGNLSGEVEVETGLSDGNTVEIISGLEEDETIYYNRVISEDASSSSSLEDMMQNFGGMGGGMGGGDMGGKGGMGGGDMGGGNMGGGPGGQ